MSLGLIYKDDRSVIQENERAGVPFLTFPILSQTGIVNHGFSTRLGGVSTGPCATMNISTTRGDSPEAVKENSRRIAAAIGVDPAHFVYTQQTHTTHVAVVKAGDEGRQFQETDGLITDVPGLCLVTFYADCVPLYFLDPMKRVIGLSHSGWKGTVGKMGKVTVQMMQRTFGCQPADLIAAIGPSICRDCYEVSADVVAAFQDAFDPALWDKLFFQTEAQRGSEHYQLDLWEANYQVLLEAGLLPAHIAVTNLCTHCNPDLLFSHRTTGNQRGNLSAFLALKV